jgi:two-component system, NarL family, response regulator DegU
MIRVAIGDDHQMFAEGMRDALHAVPDFRVVGIAGDAEALIAITRVEPVDVALIDLEMPGGGGLAALAGIDDDTVGLIVTMHISPETLDRAVESGAVGVFSKGAPLAELASGIRAAASGAIIPHAGPERSELLNAHSSPVVDPGAASLTDREVELLSLLATGVSSTEDLADRLYISQKTVKNHLASIYTKLSVSDRTQAAIEAIRLGFARPK